ncbi:MAG TPA: twin-arginine translocase TatA/TatE family subunit, partial [Acidimicrobiales bacterium]|nr:twin-arginine translocase TatA/TatE family subunit [Acidimicrobiales bacterium]
MLDITPLKVVIVLVVALVVLGPDRLPRLAHQVARAWGDFQRFRHQIDAEVRQTVLGSSPTQATQVTDSGPPAETHHHEAGPERIMAGTEQPPP